MNDSINNWMNVTVDLEERILVENDEELWVELPDDTIQHINTVFETDTALQMLGVRRKNSNSIGIEEMWEIKADIFKTPNGSPSEDEITTNNACATGETTNMQNNVLRNLFQWCVPHRQSNISNQTEKKNQMKSQGFNVQHKLQIVENIPPYSPPKLGNKDKKTNIVIDRESLSSCEGICFDIDSENESDEEDYIDPSFYTQTL